MKRILAFATLLFAPLFAIAQSQYVAFSASNIADAAGNKVSSGTFSVTPANSAGIPVAPHGTSGVRAVPRPVVFKIVGGALQPSFGSLQLLDVALATPQNFCYVVSIHDNTSGRTWSPDSCMQPTYTANWCTITSGVTICNYDNYVPTSTPGAMTQTGPAGVNWRGTWSNATGYALNDGVSYNGSSYVSTQGGNTNTPGGSGWSLLAMAGTPGPNCSTSSAPGECDLGNTTLKAGTVAAVEVIPGEAGIADWHNSLSACASYRGRINIMDCGGDATGSVDSTTAIRLALARATDEAEIYFPSGTYRVDGDIKLPEITKKITIVGESAGVGGRKNQPGGGAVINYTGTGTLFESDDPTNVGNSPTQDAYMLGLSMRDITLQGSTVSTTSVGLNLDGMNHVNITRVRVRGFYRGLVGGTASTRAMYSVVLEDVNFRSYGTVAYPNAEYGTYHLMDTAIQFGAYGGDPLWVGHIAMTGVHTEQVRAGLVLTSVSNITTTGFTVDTSCTGIEGNKVEFSTFINSYLDANPSHATTFGGCGDHISGRRISLLGGGRGNVIWPTQGDGQGADPDHPDAIQPETTTVLSPAGDEDADTTTRISGAALELGDSVNMYVANKNGIKTWVPETLALVGAPYTSIAGKSITFTAANTLSVGKWVAFTSIDSPSWMRTYFYYFVSAADASSFTLEVPLTADGTSGTSTAAAYYKGAKIDVLQTGVAKNFVLGSYAAKWPIIVYGDTTFYDNVTVDMPSGLPFTVKNNGTTGSGNSTVAGLCPSIAAGDSCQEWLGIGLTTSSAAYRRFHRAVSGGNFITEGFYGGYDLFARWSDGHTFIGTNPVDNGYTLEVNGSAKIDGALTADNHFLTLDCRVGSGISVTSTGVGVCNSASTTIGNVRQTMAYSGTVVALYCFNDILPTTGESYTWTVYHGVGNGNPAATAMAAVGDASANYGSTAANTFAFSAGDSLVVKASVTTTSTTTRVDCQLKIVP